MIVEIKYESIEVADGIVRVRTKDDAVTISKDSGIIGGINLIKDLRISLREYLQKLSQ